MLHVVLYQPQIPANTGNIIRLCANTGAQLHLIEPLGFVLEDKKLRRAGLDYHEWAEVRCYPHWENFSLQHPTQRIFALSTKGTQVYSQVTFAAEDMLLFGSETAGLPSQILYAPRISQQLTLPMQAQSRSLNLSNTVAIVLYEAWKQLDFM